MAEVAITACGEARAEDVHRLTQRAFAGYGALDPPSGALRESADQVRRDLAAGGGALAEEGARLVGCLRWRLAADGSFSVRRVAVEPDRRGRGIGQALMGWAEREARRRGCAAVSVGVRVTLPGNLAFFRRLGYRVTAAERHPGYERTTALAMRKHLDPPGSP